jgi:hypothetical protein
MADDDAAPALPDGTVAMFLLVRRPDGSPTGYPMTGLCRSGNVEFTTYRKAAKARYLLADNRVCCVIPDENRRGCGIAVWGRAEETDEHGFFSATAAPTTAAPMEVPSSVRRTVQDRLQSNKRMVFRVRVERARSLDSIEVPDAEG